MKTIFIDCNAQLGEVWRRIYRPNDPPVAINSVPFATLSMTRDVARSVGDVATLLVDDRRRVLHALWAQPVDEAGTPALRIFHAQAQLKK